MESLLKSNENITRVNDQTNSQDFLQAVLDDNIEEVMECYRYADTLSAERVAVCALRSSLDMIKFLVSLDIEGFNTYIFLFACELKRIKIVEYILEQDVDVNIKQSMALFEALLNRNEKLVKLLVKKGAILPSDRLNLLTGPQRDLLKKLNKPSNGFNFLFFSSNKHKSE